jgi:hypothetical protein
LEKIVKFDPAYDKRSSDHKKNYGVHGVTLRMVLKGNKGAVQFVLFTNWMLPNVSMETDLRILEKASHGINIAPEVLDPIPDITDKRFDAVKYGMESAKRLIGMSNPDKLDLLDLDIYYHPLPADLGFHSLVPIYKEQTLISDSCEFLDGKPCYYDGSGLAAKKVYDILLTEGSDGVWKYLYTYYCDTFNVQEEL